MKNHEHEGKQGITKWPYQQIRCCTSTYCVHTLNTKTIRSNLKSLNIFTKEISSPNVKFPKVGSNAIVPVPVGTGPNKSTIQGSTSVLKLKMLEHTTSIYSLFIQENFKFTPFLVKFTPFLHTSNYMQIKFECDKHYQIQVSL